MRIAQINMIPYGSTGNIMLQIAQTAREEGHEALSLTTVPFDKKEKKKKEAEKLVYWGSIEENRTHYYLGSLLGRNGCYTKRGTRQLIRMLEQFQPDVIHLHNLHKFCINLPLLFAYIKRNSIRTIWTLHDCWSFTGQCPCFDMVACEKWKTGCHHCPQLGVYPRSRIDNTKRMYQMKKKWFTGVKDMTLVTPSCWLADLTRESFLKDYPVQVIRNGIDLSVFKPIESDFRKKYSIENKIILLGVSLGWSKRKGLDVFIELSKRLDVNYQIVLIGTDEAAERLLPDNIIAIRRTANQKELAQIYSAADLFVNPTREDNFPTVNMEALACGTPVVTFRTGGSPEALDETCGSVVDCDDVDAMEKEIRRICTTKPFSKDTCLKRAAQFDRNVKFKEYVDLYENCSHSTQCAL